MGTGLPKLSGQTVYTSYSCRNLLLGYTNDADRQSNVHLLNPDTGFCAYGCGTRLAVATTQINGIITGHATLAEAINAVKNANAADKAVVKLLKSIDLDSKQRINSGVFTLDLNSKALSSSATVLSIYGSGVNVTIADSGNGGSITTSSEWDHQRCHSCHEHE